MITLRQLRYLQALARHRHFGRAAETCAVTQPALSMQIRELEKELDVELVERRPGDAALTEIGVLVAQRGDEVLAAARDLVDFARHRGRLFQGQLKLGVIPTLAPYLLPKLLPLLQARYPEVVVKLRETQTKGLIEELVAGDLDAVMLALPAPGSEIEVIPLIEDPFLLAVPADDPHSETARVSAREVDQSRLILLEEGHCLRDQSVAVCDAVGLGRRRDDAQAAGLESLRQMVMAGIGIALVPELATHAPFGASQLAVYRRFAPPEPTRDLVLAWRRSFPRGDALQGLARGLREALTSQAVANRSARS